MAGEPGETRWPSVTWRSGREEVELEPDQHRGRPGRVRVSLSHASVSGDRSEQRHRVGHERGGGARAGSPSAPSPRASRAPGPVPTLQGRLKPKAAAEVHTRGRVAGAPTIGSGASPSSRVPGTLPLAPLLQISRQPGIGPRTCSPRSCSRAPAAPTLALGVTTVCLPHSPVSAQPCPQRLGRPRGPVSIDSRVEGGSSSAPAPRRPPANQAHLLPQENAPQATSPDQKPWSVLTGSEGRGVTFTSFPDSRRRALWVTITSRVCFSSYYTHGYTCTFVFTSFGLFL